ncbi:MAG: hypothetical protein KF813_07740 [Trueperaceae bacterium]|nr:hypothetical protein [Trueperaceae bacterium]
MRTVEAVLEEIRRRVFTDRALAVTPWAVAVGICGYTTLRIVGQESLLAAAQAMALTTFGLALGLFVWVMLRPITAKNAARLIDERLNTHDLFAATFEVSPNSSVVAAALHMEASREAQGVSGRDVLALKWRVTGSIAILVTSLMGVVAYRGATDGWLSQPTRRNGSETVAASRVFALAEVAEAAAEATGDPHMAAIARAIGELARQAEADQSNEVSVDERLTELVRSLERAAGLRSRDTPTSSLRDREPGGPSSPKETLTSLEERLGRIASFTGIDESQFVFAEDSQLLFGEAQGGLGAGSSQTIGSTPGEATAAQQSGLQGLPSLLEDDTLTGISNAELLGASSNATSGASNLAGMGSEELFGDEETVSVEGVLAAISVDGTPTQSGRHVMTEVPPDLAGDDRPSGSNEDVSSSPAFLPSSAAHTLSSRYREAAGTYFLPSQETINSRTASR